MVFDQRCYDLPLELSLYLDIEDELGSLDAFHRSLNHGGWQLGQLVSAVQILLQAAGRTVDFMELGNRMIAEGIGVYHRAVCEFLSAVIVPPIGEHI